MFGNILIDKLRFYVPVNDLMKEDLNFYRDIFKSVFSKHFAQNAYYIKSSKKGSKITVEFNPTRYFRDINDLEKYTDTNLEMPSMEDLQQLFDELPRELTYNAKITKIHLTKNLLVRYKVKEYIDMLNEREYKHPYHALLYTGKKTYPTLTLSSLAYSIEEKDNSGDREIIMYDKCGKLDESGIDEVWLKTPLTEEELHGSKLCLSCNSLESIPLGELNILRSEMQFETSSKLAEISKFLKLEYIKGLLLNDFYQLLAERQLYKKLDEFYTHVQRILLSPEVKDDSPLNVWQNILIDNWQYVKTLPIDNVYKETGLWNKYHHSLLKLQDKVQNELLEEIKMKLGI